MEDNIIEIDYKESKFLITYKDTSFYFDETGKIGPHDHIDFLKFVLALDFRTPITIKDIRFQDHAKDKELNINDKKKLIKTWLECLDSNIQSRIQSDELMAPAILERETLTS